MEKNTPAVELIYSLAKYCCLLSIVPLTFYSTYSVTNKKKIQTQGQVRKSYELHLKCVQLYYFT